MDPSHLAGSTPLINSLWPWNNPIATNLLHASLERTASDNLTPACPGSDTLDSASSKTESSSLNGNNNK